MLNIWTTQQFISDSGEEILIWVLIVPNIAIPMQNVMTQSITSLSHLKGLKFVHLLNTDPNFEISLLWFLELTFVGKSSAKWLSRKMDQLQSVMIFVILTHSQFDTTLFKTLTGNALESWIVYFLWFKLLIFIYHILQKQNFGVYRNHIGH